MSIAGISVTISWMGIALSQYMFRKKFIKAGGKTEDLQYIVPFYPFVPLFCLGFCSLILVFLAFDPTQRVGLFYGIGFLVACILFYKFKLAKKAESNTNLENEKIL
jgi:arginine/ornithine permease